MDDLPSASPQAIWDELTPQLEAGARTWLESALHERALLADPLRFRVAFAQVARKLGNQGALLDLARLSLLIAAFDARSREQQLG